MSNELQNKRVAILVTGGFEYVELTKPKQALEELWDERCENRCGSSHADAPPPAHRQTGHESLSTDLDEIESLPERDWEPNRAYQIR